MFAYIILAYFKNVNTPEHAFHIMLGKEPSAWCSFGDKKPELEMKNMMCDYDYNGQYVSSSTTDICSRCRNGMMILVGIISGLVFAALVVLLYINSLLTAMFPAVLTSLITGLAALGLVTAAALFSGDNSRTKGCIRCHLGGLFFGIIGTIISSFLAISTDLAAGSVIAAVTVGMTAFFFAYLLVSLLFIVLCASKQNN